MQDNMYVKALSFDVFKVRGHRRRRNSHHAFNVGKGMWQSRSQIWHFFFFFQSEPDLDFSPSVNSTMANPRQRKMNRSGNRVTRRTANKHKKKVVITVSHSILAWIPNVKMY